MKSPDVRSSFLDYFRQRGHRPWPSAPLVPHGDPTLLFTNAGMVQFKGYFLGEEEPPERRAVSVQKCLRVSGKHNDLENVGPSPRHHTFFEMLGNFSFGDYFKDEAIRFGWELVTEGWGLPPAHLFATVFHEDDEAYALWRRISGLPEERVLRCGMADNFWAMGETGPCGPCSEIFVDLHPGRPQVGWEEGTESGRYLEIWNLVFMQYDRDAAGTLTPLPRPSVDTGAGLERVTAVLQGAGSNYDTDLFQPILRAAAELAGRRYGQDGDRDVSLRVIADHLRAVTFLLADGVIPGPGDRGYVLRRILRRAVRHGMLLDFDAPFLHRLVPVLGEVMGEAYPELGATRDASVATVRAEEEKFFDTIASGARQMEEELASLRQAGESVVPGKVVFTLYDTFGLPVEVMRDIAEEERFAIDEAGFEAEMTARRAASRATTARAQEQQSSLKRILTREGELSPTEFVGYETLALEGVEVRGAVPTAGSSEIDTSAKTISSGQQGVVVLDRTVFYAEGGGQVGDTGTISWPDGRARVEDTHKDATGAYFHTVTVEKGTLAQGQRVDLAVDAERRRAVERHHTATHLLHAALRQVLGPGVRQAGSLVAPDRLRFDFTHPRPLTDDERREVEARVNAWARAADAVGIEERGHEEALAAGAMALFGEKYGERVRTVAVPGVSLELCGGCHVRNSGEIGLFLVTGERGVASGVRRIEAVAGEAAFRRVREREELLAAVAGEVGAPPERSPAEAAALKERLERAEAELARLRLELVSGAAGAAGGAAGAETVDVDGFRVLAREVPPAPANELRSMADALRGKLGSGVVVLGTRGDGKVTLLAAVTADLAGRVSAGELVRRLAPLVGGGGGGRPDFAQAGGKLPERLPEALAEVERAVREQLGE
jgi:alanyl-tRNA synthetase